MAVKKQEIKKLRVLVGCECSGVVREAFKILGHDAWSCDIIDADDDSKFHLKGDVRNYLNENWDLGIFHPPCTRLCNSGVQWLYKPSKTKTIEQMWKELDEGAKLFSDCWNANIPYLAVENPIMHKHAKERILNYKNQSQVVQPWWFGEKAFKGTSLYLKNLPLLKPTNKLIPPNKIKEPDEYKTWSFIHLASDNKKRASIRSKTFLGIANAMAIQWSQHILKEQK